MEFEKDIGGIIAATWQCSVNVSPMFIILTTDILISKANFVNGRKTQS